jgi:uncharacterized tellurite resistance protein B-like protein
MFFRRKSTAPEHENQLDTLIEGCLPDADEDTRKIVVAVAGLFGCVSYADRDFSTTEQRLVENLLQTIVGIDAEAAKRILAALRENIVHISTVEAPRYARTLKQLGDRDLRLHVLDMLLDVAAADHELSQAEVVMLRQTTNALGLEQSDYNVLQGKHRALLAALRED